MVGLKYIQSMGNQLMAVMDDGTKYYAVGTGQNMWLHSRTAGGGTVDPPDPNAPFVWPFPLSSSNIANGWPDDGFHTPGRPKHEGLDFGYGLALDGAENRAACSGTITVAGEYFGYGNAVIIDHGDHGGHNLKTLYGHNKWGSLPKGVGATVNVKEKIGLVGNTGNSFGAHLHFETWIDDVKVDPMAFMTTYNPTNADAYS